MLNFNDESRKQDMEDILKMVEKVWMENPELRFCQLISNCFSHGEDFYYKYDADFVKIFTDRYTN